MNKQWDTASAFTSPAGFRGPANGDRVCLRYVASTSGTQKSVTGEVMDGSRHEFTRLTTDDGEVYQVCGTGLADRDQGEVMRNGRRIGKFDSASEVTDD